MPKDPVESVLDALARHSVAVDEPSLEELDRIYSEAVSEGLISEQALRASFARFLERVQRAEDQSEPALAPAATISIGSGLQKFRAQRSLTVKQVAHEYDMSIEQVRLLENSQDSFGDHQLADTAKALAKRIGARAARVHTLLQAVRATLQVRSSDGPELKAARKVPRR